MSVEEREKTAKGILYLVATPIGNLMDFSERAIEVLKSVDLIAAEDTRNSLKLLNHFGIRTPMTSYHEFNRFDKAEELVRVLSEGRSVACITDAGTPGISDPGEVLVSKCAEEGITVSAVPGASAMVMALILSGLPTRRFRFEGFLPTEKPEREALLDELRTSTATLVFYEAPHRLKKTLEILFNALGDRRAALCRELTKVHEEVLRMTLREALDHYSGEEPRGEYVIVVEGITTKDRKAAEAKDWEGMSIADHVAFYEAAGMDRKAAMKQVSLDRNISRRAVFDALVSAKS